jgi:hypothetical protein
MSSNATHDADTLMSGGITTDTHQSVVGGAPPGLHNHIVAAAVIGSDTPIEMDPPLLQLPGNILVEGIIELNVLDAGDLARLRSLSCAMRDAVAEVRTQADIPGLPTHLVVKYILRSEYFDDPADLARLPAVSRGMRDAVAATGLRFVELGEVWATELGCSSAVQRQHRRGLLLCQEYLCEAAASGGYLEELKVLRENGCPWDELTCANAAGADHLEMLQWARANGCP